MRARVWEFEAKLDLEVIAKSMTWEFKAVLPELEVIPKSVIWEFGEILSSR